MTELIHKDCGGEIEFRPGFYGQALPCVEIVCGGCETHLGVVYDVEIESATARNDE